MPEYVLGRNVTVLISHDFGSGDQFYPLFCAKSMELDTIQEEIESTTITSGTDREFEIGIQSGVLTLVGITKTKDPPDVEKMGPFTLYSLKRIKKSYQAVFQDQDGDSATFLFDGLLRRLDFASNVLSFNQSTAEIRISGALTPSSAVCVPVGFDAFDFPDGAVGVPYDFTWPMTGTAPFSRGAGLPTKPSWMVISTGSTVNSSGTPTAAGTFDINIVITNCGGGSTVTITKTITVT